MVYIGAWKVIYNLDTVLHEDKLRTFDWTTQTPTKMSRDIRGVKELGAIQIILCMLVYYKALTSHVLYVESCVLPPFSSLQNM